MQRILILPLLIFTLSMACMAQTFQYSRGWTNGKRAPNALSNNRLQTDDDNIMNSVDNQSFDRKLERCLQYLERYASNAFLRRATPFSSPTLPLKNPHNNRNNDDGINLYPSHHQSSDLFDEPNSGAAIEATDYGKH